MIDPRDQRIARLEAVIAQQQAVIAQQQATIARLEARVADLEARLGQNSSNSGKPPSSDAPADRDARRRTPPSGKHRGGQPGHKGHKRAVFPPEQVTSSHDHFPNNCAGCGHRLRKKASPEPLVHQVVEMPVVKPDVTEHRLHATGCDHCGVVTRAALPDDVPRGMCGPRLLAFICLMTGAYHLSRRQAVSLLGDVLGIRISLGALSKAEGRLGDALKPVVDDALEYACRQRVKHVDGTGWRQSAASRTLWTIATTMVTVFGITLDGTRDQLAGLLGSIRGLLISDRAPQFDLWAMKNRQICWAHLIRKFAAFAEDRRPPVAALGNHLLYWAQTLMHQYHLARDGTISRAELRRSTHGLRMFVEALLRRGVDLRIRGVSGSCQDMLEHQAALWTFLDQPGVEPTNNHAERELRGFVLWRKKSFGSQSDRGTRYAERVMTVVHSLRKQNRHVLSFLTHVAEHSMGQRNGSPSLTP